MDSEIDREIRKLASSESPSSNLPFDSIVYEKVQTFYDQLIHIGRDVFARIKENQSPDFRFLAEDLQRFIDVAQERDSELIPLILKPYPQNADRVFSGANRAILSILLGTQMRLENEALLELAVAAFLSPVDGNPLNLAAGEIHRFSRFIEIAQDFDALMHDEKEGAAPMPPCKAVMTLMREKRNYHPDVLKAFTLRLGVYPAGSVVKLSNRQTAKVICQTPGLPLSPTVQIEQDQWGRAVTSVNLLDLSQHPLIHILGLAEEVKHSPERPAQPSEEDKRKRKSRQRARRMRKFILNKFLPILISTVISVFLTYWILSL